MYECFACMYVCEPCVYLVPRRVGGIFPGTRATDDYELHFRCWELNAFHLKEDPGSLTTPFSQLCRMLNLD